MQNDRTQYIRILRWATFFIFFGRAYQHLFWDAPYRSFFWSESILKLVIERLFSMSWQEYVTSPVTDSIIQNIIKGNGIIYAISAVCTLLIQKSNARWFKYPLYLGGISLIILSILITKNKFYHTAQFFEHSLQFGVPFLFTFIHSKFLVENRLVLYLKILTALTFASHGLYALGFYPVPGNFIDMLINITGISEQTSITVLYIAGVLDLIIAVLLFVPKISIYAAGYAFVWGLLTALARVVANFSMDFPLQSLHHSLYETLYRLCHALIPLYLFLEEKRKQKLR